MYEVYCDGKLMQNFDIKGLCLVNPVLDLEVNKVGKFEFDIYPDHPYYNFVKKQKSIVVIKCKGKIVFRGRVLDDESGMFNQKHVMCEGEMAFLNDSIQRPYDFFTGDKHTTVSELFTFFITNHNAQVKEERQFKIGNITVVDENDYIVRKDSSYPNTWESVNKKLIDSLGGYIRVRHESDGNYIDYIDDFNTINQQFIEFGINLLDVSKDRRGSGVATAIIPLGAKLSEDEDAPRLTIESVNDGVDFIFDEDAVNEYGLIIRPIVFNEVNLAENLLRKGRRFLATVNYIPESLRVTAADLAGTGLNISPFSFESYIHVVSKVHDIDTVMLVSKMTIELNNPGKNEMTVGRTWKTLTGETSDIQSSNKDIVERVEKTENNLKINQGAVEEIKINSVYKTEVLYAVSESDTEAPAGPWSPSYEWIPRQYVWQKIVTTKGNGTVKESEPVCITGAQGPAGKDGEDAIWTYIESVNGFVFGSNIATTVTARICKGQEEIDPGGEFDYTWYGKTDGDWEIIGAGKSMTLNSAEERMQLYFEADGDGVRYSLTDHEGNYLTDNYGNRLVV